MGYPQPAGTASNIPTVQESVSTVLGHAIGQFEEVEKRLTGLRERIENRNQLGKEPSAPPTTGVLNQSLCLRNISARLVERCNEIESLL